jgi:hypothetical protein
VARSSFTGPIRPVGPAQKLEEAFTEAPERFDNENHNESPALIGFTASPNGRRSCSIEGALCRRPRNIVPSGEWQWQVQCVL